MRVMAKDPQGNSYVAERTVADATVKVAGVPGVDFPTERRGDVVIWPEAPYDIIFTREAGVESVRAIRWATGLYDVPSKEHARKIPLHLAVEVAAGRATVTPRQWRGSVRPPRSSRNEVNVRTGANAPAGPAVIAEDRANWTLKQGDRIMRHLALYPDGVDAQTMSAGMHELSASQIRGHLKRLMKDGGPVVSADLGYARRQAS